MYIVFDVGGTKTRIGLAQNYQTLDSNQIFDTAPNPSSLITNIQSLVSNHPITAIAGGLPGILNTDKSQLTASPNLPTWINLPLKQLLSDSFSCPVFLENDAALVGLGEACCGAGASYSIVAYITHSTGVGGSRVVARRIDTKNQGFEPGHQNLLINGDQVTTLENLISGHALQQKYGLPAKAITDSVIWSQVETYLSIGLANTILHWSPDVLVLGGSIGHSLSLDHITKLLPNYLHSFPPPPVVHSTLGNIGGLYGSLTYLSNQII